MALVHSDPTVQHVLDFLADKPHWSTIQPEDRKIIAEMESLYVRDEVMAALVRDDSDIAFFAAEFLASFAAEYDSSTDGWAACGTIAAIWCYINDRADVAQMLHRLVELDKPNYTLNYLFGRLVDAGAKPYQIKDLVIEAMDS